MAMDRKSRSEKERIEDEYQRLQNTCDMSPEDFHLCACDWLEDWKGERGDKGPATPIQWVSAAVWISQNLGRK